MGRPEEVDVVVSDNDQRCMGRFLWNVTTGQWFWDRGMLDMHGYRPGAVEVTTELLLAHKAPDHRASAEAVLATVARGDGDRDFSNFHRIVDTSGRVRTVLSVGSSRVDNSRPMLSAHIVSGFMVDLSDDERRSARQAVEQVRRGSAPIQQSLGLLMGSLHIDEDAAFAFLARVSSHHNVKVRDLARQFMIAVVSSESFTIADVPRALVRQAATLAEEHLRADAPGPT